MKIEQCPIDNNEKHRMVAQAAYFRFAERGFVDSDPLQDWLVAEAQIENSIRQQCRRPHRKSLVETQRWGLFETVSGWWHRRSLRATD